MSEWPALMNLMNGLALESVELLQWLPSCTPSSAACHPVETPALPSHSSLMMWCTLRARLSMCNKHAQFSGSCCKHMTYKLAMLGITDYMQSYQSTHVYNGVGLQDSSSGTDPVCLPSVYLT